MQDSCSCFVNVREEPGETEVPRRKPSPQSREQSVGFLVRLPEHLEQISPDVHCWAFSFLTQHIPFAVRVNVVWFYAICFHPRGPALPNRKTNGSHGGSVMCRRALTVRWRADPVLQETRQGKKHPNSHEEAVSLRVQAGQTPSQPCLWGIWD